MLEVPKQLLTVTVLCHVVCLFLQLLKISIISGQQLPKEEGGGEKGEIIDPYVEIEITGLDVDKTTFKTNYVLDNGWLELLVPVTMHRRWKHGDNEGFGPQTPTVMGALPP